MQEAFGLAVGKLVHHPDNQEMKAWAIPPDGPKRTLLHIKQWDFNWQDEYRFAERVALPAGTTLAMEYTYDNSSDNPRNPHRPPRRVLYGPGSSDEMGDLWIQVVPRRGEDLQTLEVDFAHKETAARLAGYTFKLDVDPDDEEAHYSLAGMLAELSRTGEAIRHYREALRIRGDFALALNDLGRLYLLEGDAEKASSLFRDAIASSPDLPQASSNLGTILLDRGRTAEAEEYFRRALRAWPDFAEAHYGLGRALEARDQIDEALGHYRHAVSVRPDFALAHFRLGNVLARTGNDDASLHHFDAALDAQPDFVPALFNRAAVLARQGKLEEATRSLEKLLRIEPEHEEARELLRRIEALR